MSDAAEAGKDLQDPDNVQDDDNSNSQNDNMSSQNQNQTESVAPAEGIKDFGNMSVRQTGINQFSVVNYRTGTVHHVNVREITCDCDDMQYNKDSESEVVCKHIQKAVHQAPASVEMDQAFLELVRDELDRLNTTSRRLEQIASSMEAGAYASGDSETSGDTPADTSSGSSSGADASDAADKLKTAFDDVIDDMQVKAHAGKIWVQTGQDTPEDWPHIGGDSTFDVLLKNPDHLEYVGEGGDDYPAHDMYDDKPGEWWKNMMDPSDVDDYITEVLE